MTRSTDTIIRLRRAETLSMSQFELRWGRHTTKCELCMIVAVFCTVHRLRPLQPTSERDRFSNELIYSVLLRMCDFIIRRSRYRRKLPDVVLSLLQLAARGGGGL